MYQSKRVFLKKIIIFVAFLFVIFPLCNCFAWMMFNVSVLEIPIHLTMRYPNARFLYKGVGYASCGSSEEWQEYNYYWTSDGLDKVMQHYAEFLPVFVKDSDTGLLKTEFDSHSPLSIPLLTTPADLDLDLYSKTYVTLVQSEGLDLAKRLRPGWCEPNTYDYGRQFEELKSLNDFLANPPVKGTLIVYRYYVWVP